MLCFVKMGKSSAEKKNTMVIAQKDISFFYTILIMFALVLGSWL